MKIKNKCIAHFLGITLIIGSINTTYFYPTITAEAHSGRTDSRGGHKDNKNKSGLGSYHYHCGGYPAHLHTDGVCPYSSTASSSPSTQKASSTSSKNSSSSASSTLNTDTEKELIKKVQEALNEKGYDCGNADGIMGKKSKQALMDFQKDNDLTIDGIIGDQVKIALNIS